jgi:hypothetical protein
LAFVITFAYERELNGCAAIPAAAMPDSLTGGPLG